MSYRTDFILTDQKSVQHTFDNNEPNADTDWPSNQQLI